MQSTAASLNHPRASQQAPIPVLSIVLLIFGIMFTLGAIAFYQFRATSLRDEAITRQQNHASEIANGIETYLISARQLANTTAALIAPLREDKTQVETLLTRVLTSAPREGIYGVGAWFEPDQFQQGERFFGPYAHQNSEPDQPPVLTYEWTTPEYNFHTQPWYIAGKDGNGEPVFTEPYFDTDLVYMSASQAFYDANGAFTGVITVDMVLPLLYDYVKKANINPAETIYVTTASGAIFVYPNEEALLDFARSRGNTPTSILDLKTSDLEVFNTANGLVNRVKVDAPVEFVDWTVHIASDENYLFGGINDLRNTMLIGGAVSWLLLGTGIFVYTRSQQRAFLVQQEKSRLETEITERKRAEESLQRMNESLEAKVEERTAELRKAKEEAEEANEVKSRFLANMSHELRTPLNAILNFSAFVADGFMGPVNSEQQDSLKKVIEAATHLLSLINDILDIAKIEVGMMELFIEEVEINACLKSAVAVSKGLLKDKPVQLITEIEPDLPITFGDKRRIQQVFLNILSNAIKFTQKGSITITARANGEDIHVSIKDTGVGIAPEDQPLVFENFRQINNDLREMPGTGLGMPISKHFVEAHGGRIWFESTPGEGTTFFVNIPVKKEELVA